MNNSLRDPLQAIVSLCKRRGFIFPGSEIYGGFANTYSYGPYGTQLKKNIKDLWWTTFVQKRANIVGLDGPILLHPKVWQASGHLSGFNDAMIDCRVCKARFRADHLLVNHLHQDPEGLSLDTLTDRIRANIRCPNCGAQDFTEARYFNLMFPTPMNKTSDTAEDVTYLRPETAQAIFLDYKNIFNTMRMQLPFGIAQIGKAFRNEITPGNFIFRMIEFEQMEIEFFFEESHWKSIFETWLEDMFHWCGLIGLKKQHLHHKEHNQNQLSHYSKRTVDITYDFPFGENELYGLAYRADFDLQQHMKFSKENLYIRDAQTNTKILPHVIEPTFGLDRSILAVLCDAYDEEELQNGDVRTVLRLKPSIAPIQIAIFPLMRKDPLTQIARKIHQELQHDFIVEYDSGGSIGKRYRRQDELGTPFCITIDFDTLEDQTVTLRDRDSMEQQRIAITNLFSTLQKAIGPSQ
jgi:glycyl-tRNA synthetase